MTRVIMRYAPCRCGCKGRDPLHRVTLEREIRNVRHHDPAILLPYAMSNRPVAEYLVAEGEIIVGGEPVDVVCIGRGDNGTVRAWYARVRWASQLPLERVNPDTTIASSETRDGES